MKVTVPLAVSGVVESCVPAISVSAAACVPEVMTGVSLVPVMVIVTAWVTTPPLWSSTWIV